MAEKLTTEQFVERVKIVHSNKYDYSKTEYVNTYSKIIIICPTHGEFTQVPKNHLRGAGCKKCAVGAREATNINKFGVPHPIQLAHIHEKVKQTNLKKYGVENPQQNPSVHEKTKQTNIERYGVENPSSNKNIREKIKQTNIEKYGTVCPLQNPSVHEKTKQTNIERYGVENPFSNKNIHKKIKRTNLKKYGVEYPQQNSTIREKTKQTNIERYGMDSPLSNVDIQEKIRQTNVEKYGVEYPQQNSTIREKTKNRNIEKYGVENPQQIPAVREKTRQTNVEKYGVESPLSSRCIQEKVRQTNLEKYGVVFHPQKHMIDVLYLLENREWLLSQYEDENKTAVQISEELNVSDTTIGRYLRKSNICVTHVHMLSCKCFSWLDSIMKNNIYIQHGFNVGEYLIPGTKYRADGFCEETNTIYEFHGDVFHGNPRKFKADDCCHPFNKHITAGELYQKTIEREEKIKALGYNLVVMWESDWDTRNTTNGDS